MNEESLKQNPGPFSNFLLKEMKYIRKSRSDTIEKKQFNR